MPVVRSPRRGSAWSAARHDARRISPALHFLWLEVATVGDVFELPGKVRTIGKVSPTGAVEY